MVRGLGLLAAVLWTATSLAADGPFAQPRPFGPGVASFPWHACFSPDGRWIAVVDGYENKARIFDATTLAESWTSPSGSGPWNQTGAFSADSRRYVTLEGESVITLAREDGVWTVDSRVALGFRPENGHLARSPAPLSLSPDGSEAVFADGGRAWCVDLVRKKVRCAAESGVHSAFLLADGTLAVGLVEPFATELRPRGGERERLPGVLLAASPDGAMWLVAADPNRFDIGPPESDECRLALEVRRARSAEALSRLELRAGAHAGEFRHRLLLQAAFTADGSLLATVEGSGAITIRRAPTMEVVQVLDVYADEHYAMGVAFAPDGETLVTGGRRRGRGLLLWRRR